MKGTVPVVGADTSARIWINPNRDRVTANWSREPDGKPQFATSPGAALDEALAEVWHVPAVIIWSRAAAIDVAMDEWRPIETFDDQPHGQANHVLIAAGSVVGEAWYRDPDGANDSWESGWWWAGTGPGEYACSPVAEINDAPTHWRPLPDPPP